MSERLHSFEALANEHKDAVYRQMLRVCGNHADAEDVLVEALFKAYRNLEQLRDSAAFRAWLARIANRVCLRIKERETLAPILQLSELEASGHELVQKDIPLDEVLAQQQLKTILITAIAALPAESRAVYELRDIDGLSGEEVAQRLGITVAAMKSRLHRARRLLREQLDRAIDNSKESSKGDGSC